jgi:hypothetical protein
MNGFRISRNDLEDLLGVSYLALQKSTFWNMTAEQKGLLLKQEITQVGITAKNYPRFRPIKPPIKQTKRDEEHTKIQEIYNEIIQETLSTNDVHKHNHWVLSPFFPTNGCSNFSMTNQETITNMTLAHRLESSRKNMRGSCKTCSKDRNASRKKDTLQLMESTIYDEAGCRLEPVHERHSQNFNLQVYFTGTAYFVRSYSATKLMHSTLLTLAKTRLPDLYQVLKNNVVQGQLPNTSVVLEVREGIRQLGVLSTLEHHGYIPHISLRNRKQKKEFIRPSVVGVLVETINAIQASCNPLQYLSIQSLLGVKDPAYKSKTYDDVWPLHFIGANRQTLSLLNEQILNSNLGTQVQNYLFKVDSNVKNKTFEFRISKVAFWM